MTEQAAPTPTENADTAPPPGRAAAALPILLGWLVPGAGHWKLGYGWAALFVAGGVIPLFVLGMAMAGWENVSLDRHPYYFAIHAFAGIPAFVAEFAGRGVVLDHRPPHQSVGLLYTAVAGLLNLVAIADVYARCVRGDPERAVAEAAHDAEGANDPAQAAPEAEAAA